MEVYQGKRLFLECNCEAEALEFKYIMDDPDSDDGKELWVALWQIGYSDPKTISLWTKLKMAFHVLKKGTLYGDQVILNKTNILRLKEWVNSLEVK